MITAIDPLSIAGLNFAPAAELAVSIDWFKARGFTFSKDADDLDEYEMAAFALESGQRILLLHYVNAPSRFVTLMLSDERHRDLATALRAAAAALELPMSKVHWAGNDEAAPLAG